MSFSSSSSYNSCFVSSSASPSPWSSTRPTDFVSVTCAFFGPNTQVLHGRLSRFCAIQSSPATLTHPRHTLIGPALSNACVAQFPRSRLGLRPSALRSLRLYGFEMVPLSLSSRPTLRGPNFVADHDSRKKWCANEPALPPIQRSLQIRHGRRFAASGVHEARWT